MTEKEANGYLEELYTRFGSVLEKESGFRYIAVINNNNKTSFEFSYKTGSKNENNVMTTQRAKELVNIIKQLLFTEVSINITPWFKMRNRIKKYVFNYDIKKTKIELNTDIKENFKHYYNNNEETKIDGKIFGDRAGTLGGIISLKHNNNNFIISNYHVLMGNKKLGAEIYYNNKPIAKLFWGLFNEQYDVAIAKINKNTSIKLNSKKYLHHKIVNINNRFYKLKNLRTFSSDGPQDKGVLYSKNAIVKIEYGNGYKLYKNQIITKTMSLVPGNSGAIIVEDSAKIKKNIVGVFIGGDSTYGIVNNLHNLFKKEIEAFKDKNDRELPKIEFKSFIN